LITKNYLDKEIEKREASKRISFVEYALEKLDKKEQKRVKFISDSRN
jgi:hypothetical protein